MSTEWMFAIGFIMGTCLSAAVIISAIHCAFREYRRRNDNGREFGTGWVRKGGHNSRPTTPPPPPPIGQGGRTSR